MKKPKLNISPAQLTAYAAIITSVLALFVSIYETRIMRSWQQASTQPIIQIEFEADVLSNPIRADLFIKNVGEGAAYIEGLKLVHDGSRVETLPELLSLWTKNLGNSVRETGSSPYRGYLEPNGVKQISNLSIKVTGDAKMVDIIKTSQQFSDAFQKSQISVCYCSVFESCWINNFMAETRVKPVTACPEDYR